MTPSHKDVLECGLVDAASNVTPASGSEPKASCSDVCVEHIRIEPGFKTR
jgi:hypothetical protein